MGSLLMAAGGSGGAPETLVFEGGYNCGGAGLDITGYSGETITLQTAIDPDNFTTAGDGQNVDHTGTVLTEPYISEWFVNAATFFEVPYGVSTAGADYAVVLRFAENFHTSVGDRVFNVYVEGGQVLTDYDIIADVGTETVATKRFNVTDNGDASIVIRIENGAADNGLINSFEIYRIT